MHKDYSLSHLPQLLNTILRPWGQDVLARLSFIQMPLRKALVLGDFPCMSELQERCEVFVDFDIDMKYDMILLWGHVGGNEGQGFFKKIFNHLTPQGCFFVGGWGQNTLKELKVGLIHVDMLQHQKAFQRLPTFATIQRMVGDLQGNGFQDVVIDQEYKQLRYDHICDLLRDLRTFRAIDLPDVPPLTLRQIQFLSKILRKEKSPFVDVTIEWYWTLAWSPPAIKNHFKMS